MFLFFFPVPNTAAITETLNHSLEMVGGNFSCVITFQVCCFMSWATISHCHDNEHYIMNSIKFWFSSEHTELKFYSQKLRLSKQSFKTTSWFLLFPEKIHSRSILSSAAIRILSAVQCHQLHCDIEQHRQEHKKGNWTIHVPWGTGKSSNIH